MSYAESWRARQRWRTKECPASQLVETLHCHLRLPLNPYKYFSFPCSTHHFLIYKINQHTHYCHSTNHIAQLPPHQSIQTVYISVKSANPQPKQRPSSTTLTMRTTLLVSAVSLASFATAQLDASQSAAAGALGSSLGSGAASSIYASAISEASANPSLASLINSSNLAAFTSNPTAAAASIASLVASSTASAATATQTSSASSSASGTSGSGQTTNAGVRNGVGLSAAALIVGLFGAVVVL